MTDFMNRAVQLAKYGMDTGMGGPFGAVVVRNGEIIAEGNNQVLSSQDPTAHAEIVAIRQAANKLGRFDLSDCEIYVSCEPCPMCLGAIYWARPQKVYYAATASDAAAIGFDDAFIYTETAKPAEARSIPFIKVASDQVQAIMQEWVQKPDRQKY